MIRQLQRNDRATFLELADEFYHSEAVQRSIPPSHYERTFEAMMRSNVYTKAYIIEDEGKTAGYALVSKTYSQEAGGTVLWLEEIYLREAFRGRGLAKEFMTFIENESKEMVVRIRLEVKRDNHYAIELYQRLGFTGMPYMQMMKQLHHPTTQE